jgi:hypothetical protein
LTLVGKSSCVGVGEYILYLGNLDSRET